MGSRGKGQRVTKHTCLDRTSFRDNHANARHTLRDKITTLMPRNDAFQMMSETPEQIPKQVTTGLKLEMTWENGTQGDTDLPRSRLKCKAYPLPQSRKQSGPLVSSRKKVSFEEDVLRVGTVCAQRLRIRLCLRITCETRGFSSGANVGADTQVMVSCVINIVLLQKGCRDSE